MDVAEEILNLGQHPDMAQQRTPEEIFNNHASAYQERFMNYDLYNDTYDALCKLLKPGAKILEAGCGPGNITKYLLSKRPDLEILGTDLAENMITLAKENCPSAEFEIMDCRNISSLKEVYDAVICGFCVPYLNKEEVEKLIADSAALLSKKGVLYLSAIEGAHDRSGYETSSDGKDACFIYYYDETTFQTWFAANGFAAPTVFRKNYPKAGGSDSTHLILISQKND